VRRGSVGAGRTAICEVPPVLPVSRLLASGSRHLEKCQVAQQAFLYRRANQSGQPLRARGEGRPGGLRPDDGDGPCDRVWRAWRPRGFAGYEFSNLWEEREVEALVVVWSVQAKHDRNQ